MRILLVGAGAVGQVYAWHLQKAGVDLGLLDRPDVAAALERARGSGGLPLYQTTYRRRRDPIERRLKDFRVLRDAAEARAFAPDQIWFAIPSPAYRTDWYREFVRTVPAGLVVCFVPEGGRPEFVPAGAAGRFVFGGTAFMAWQGGAERGGGREGGVNFWRPPLGIPLAGTAEGCRAVGAILKEAGFGYTADPPGSKSQAATTAAMTAFVSGLELAGWSLGRYRGSPWMRRAAAASGEAIRGQLPAAGGLQRALLGDGVLSAAFFLVSVLLPLLVPFDLEKYLRFHYTKTRKQSLALLELFAADAVERKLPVGNIFILLDAMREGHPR
jgi:hypothetical protein